MHLRASPPSVGAVRRTEARRMRGESESRRRDDGASDILWRGEGPCSTTSPGVATSIVAWRKLWREAAARRGCQADVRASTPRLLRWWRPAAAPQPCIGMPGLRPLENARTDGKVEAIRIPSSARHATKMLRLLAIRNRPICRPK